MKLTVCVFSLLLTQIVFNKPPTWFTCNDAVTAFAASEEKWTCERGGKALGSGSSGITYVLKNKDGLKAVCKVMNYDEKNVANGAAMELKYFNMVKGLPNIVKLYDQKIIETQRGSIAIILQEFAENGDLFDFYQKSPSFFANPRKIAKLMAGIANGVKQMHNNKLVHADLKLDNIVVTAGNVPKLIDFDLSNDMDKTGLLKGTPEYIDPALYQLTPRIYTEKSDVYSLGVVYYCISTGSFPFSGNSFNEVKDEVTFGAIEIPQGMDLSVAKLILSCLQLDPARRPTMDELISKIDTYLRSPQDQLIKKVLVDNRSVPNETVYKVISTKDRSTESQNYISTGEVRLLSQEKEEAEVQWMFPLVLAVSSILMFLVFRAISNWVDDLGHQAKVSQEETPVVGISTAEGDLTIAMDSGAQKS